MSLWTTDCLKISPKTYRLLRQIAKQRDCNVAAALEEVIAEWGNRT